MTEAQQNMDKSDMWLIRDARGLTTHEKVFLYTVASRGMVKTSRKRLMEDTAMSTGMVTNVVRSLQAKDLINVYPSTYNPVTGKRGQTFYSIKAKELADWCSLHELGAGSLSELPITDSPHESECSPHELPSSPHESECSPHESECSRGGVKGDIEGNNEGNMKETKTDEPKEEKPKALPTALSLPSTQEVALDQSIDPLAVASRRAALALAAIKAEVALSKVNGVPLVHEVNQQW